MTLVSRWTAVFLLASSAVFFAPQMSVPVEIQKEDYVEEARQLYAIENDYFQKRVNSDWQAIYDYQHPEFRENVSMEEFKFFDGWLTRDWWEYHPMHVSGTKSQFLEHIRKNQEKKDALGYPAPRKYKLFSDPLFTMKKYSIVKIAVSKNKKYAITQYKADGKKLLPPWYIREFITFDHTLVGEDFWEKVDGRWVITVLKDTTWISGSKYQYYFIPNNKDSWDQMEFVEIEPSLFLPQNS